jgi:hypothetical protein
MTGHGGKSATSAAFCEDYVVIFISGLKEITMPFFGEDYVIFIRTYLANKKVQEENRPVDKPHQHFFFWVAHLVRAHDTISHAAPLPNVPPISPRVMQGSGEWSSKPRNCTMKPGIQMYMSNSSQRKISLKMSP